MIELRPDLLPARRPLDLSLGRSRDESVVRARLSSQLYQQLTFSFSLFVWIADRFYPER